MYRWTAFSSNTILVRCLPSCTQRLAASPRCWAAAEGLVKERLGTQRDSTYSFTFPGSRNFLPSGAGSHLPFLTSLQPTFNEGSAQQHDDENQYSCKGLRLGEGNCQQTRGSK